MNLNQYTDAQLTAEMDSVCLEYLATSESSHTFPRIERELDALYEEAEKRGLLK